MRGVSSLLVAIDMEVRGKDVALVISSVERETHENDTVGFVCLTWSTFPPVD